MTDRAATPGIYRLAARRHGFLSAGIDSWDTQVLWSVALKFDIPLLYAPRLSGTRRNLWPRLSHRLGTRTSG